MFHNHFALTGTPFERDLPTRKLYESSQFSEALARLQYSCQRRTLSVLTGEIGAGKSTLLRMLRERFDPNHYFFVYIADSNLTPRNFYTLVLSALSLNPPGLLPRLKKLFKDILTDFYETKDITCIIAIDEAQTLDISMLQELRFIMNFYIDSFSPMAIILSGQSEFRSTLRTLHMTPIRRRVDTSYHLGVMSAEETKAYITFQLENAGCTRPLFCDDVITRIQERAKGIPAMINILCKGCLIDAASRGQELVDVENFNRALNELS